jgi:hypothetical protein
MLVDQTVEDVPAADPRGGELDNPGWRSVGGNRNGPGRAADLPHNRRELVVEDVLSGSRWDS